MLGLHRRLLPLGHIALNNGMQIIHAVQIGVGQIADLRLNVARNGDIDQQHRPVAARLQRALDHSFTDDRQRAGRRADNDIGVRQAGVDIRQRDHLSPDLIGQRLGTLTGTVGDHHMLYLVLMQMAGHQLNGLTRPDQQHVKPGQRLKDLARQRTGGKRHRHHAGADFGFRTYPLGHRESL